MEPLEELVRTMMAMTRQVLDSDLIKECLDKAIEEDNERRDGTGRALKTVMERVGSYAYELSPGSHESIIGIKLPILIIRYDRAANTTGLCYGTSNAFTRKIMAAIVSG